MVDYGISLLRDYGVRCLVIEHGLLAGIDYDGWDGLGVVVHGMGLGLSTGLGDIVSMHIRRAYIIC